MASFSQGDVIRVPFPYTDRNARHHRPALVVSPGGLGERSSLLWVVMITSAANGGWPNDVALDRGYEAAGLPVPSIIRPTKMTTVEARHADRIGKLDRRIWREVASILKRQLGFE